MLEKAVKGKNKLERKPTTLPNVGTLDKYIDKNNKKDNTLQL